MRIGIIAVVLASLAACSSTPSDNSGAVAQQSDPSKGIICTYERPVGSFLREKKCTTPEQRAAERGQQEVMMDQRNERDSGL